MRTVYVRGHGTESLATLVDAESERVRDNLAAEAIEHRADLLVAKRIGSGRGLLPVAAPRDIDLERTDRVIAAVGGGPHSELAARVALAVGVAKGIPSRMICAYPEDESPEQALGTVEHLAELVPDLDYLVLPGAHVQDLLTAEGEGALLVLGAPGGSFLERRYLGSGARLIANAPVGAVVVQSAPRRAFHAMSDPQWVGVHMSCIDALALHDVDPIPVVDAGAVVGCAHRSDLEEGGRGPVGDVMVEVEPVDAEVELDGLESGSVLPVVHDGRLVGLLGAT